MCPKEVREAGEYPVELVPEGDGFVNLDQSRLVESSDEELVKPPHIDFENIPVPQMTTDSEGRVHDPDQTLRQSLGDQDAHVDISSQRTGVTSPGRDSDLQGKSSDYKDPSGYGGIPPADAKSQGDSGSQTLPFNLEANAALSGTNLFSHHQIVFRTLPR